MAQQLITIGAADAKLGDTLFTGGGKINGNFTELYDAKLDSTITVKQSNIGTTLGGTIDSTKVYLIDGIIDFTGTGFNITVPAGGVNILGSTFDVAQLVCTENNYTLFESDLGGAGDVLAREIAIEITGSNSQVFNLTDSDGSHAFEFARVNYNSCTSLGTITDYRQGLETGTGRFGGTPELTLAGTWSGGYFIDTSIVRGLTLGTYSLYKAGAGFAMASRFRSNQNIDLPSSASFFDFSISNFANPSTLQIDSSIITRNGSSNASDPLLTPNITASALASSWTGNQGLDNTFPGGTQTITSEVLTVITTINTFVDVLGTFTATDLQHFDAPSNGQLRHLGDSPREYRVFLDATVEGTSGNVLALKVVKWDDSLSSFVDVGTQAREVNSLVGARNVAFYTMLLGVTLDQGDYIKIQIENQTGTANATVELDMFFTVMER